MLQVTKEQRKELSKWAASRTLAAGDVFRSRLILALADGQSYAQIMTSLQTTAPTISRWKKRFEEKGLAGLDPLHKGSQPRVADARVQARIARKTQQKPADGSTHWSCRKMAQALGLSKSTVQRVWAQTRLKPHRLDRYMASNDPRFEEKAADIIGLYMNPPQHAAVFCVELWFAKIQRDVIARGVFTSVADLGNKLRKYIRAYSKSARAFRWTYTDPTHRIRPNKITGTAY